jgi:hypothetical protein
MPWKSVSILWPAIVAALQPLDLPTLLQRWPRLMKRLAAMQAPIDPTALDDCSRPRQVERFRAWFALELQTSA